MKETFNYMHEKYDFYNKDTILMTGVSAGGIATYFWMNYLYDNTKSSKVFAFPDSGLFRVDFVSPIYHIKLIKESSKYLQ